MREEQSVMIPRVWPENLGGWNRENAERGKTRSVEEQIGKRIEAGDFCSDHVDHYNLCGCAAHLEEQTPTYLITLHRL